MKKMDSKVTSDFYMVVLMPAYNHEQFIAQAISGVTSQITQFVYKLFIVDDSSTDKTYEICKQYADTFPDKIVLLKNEENLGANRTGEILRELGFGSGAKYIAICEGDDYWTDPYKLQKQVDFLEMNPDYALCFHRVYELEDRKQPVLSNLNSSEKEETYTIQELAKSNFIHTPSVIFRNGLIEQFPPWLKESPVGDYVLHMLSARHGKIKYFPQPMAVYRRHSNGIWSNKSQLHQSTGWVWMLANLANEFKNTDVEKILLKQKEENDLYIANFYT